MEVHKKNKERAYFPEKHWKRSTPDQQGMDSNLLADAIRYIECYFKNYIDFIVIKNGYLIFESHNNHPYEDISSQFLKACFALITKILRKPGDTFRDKHSDLYNLRSVTKSIISILVGIAIDKGYIKSTEDKAFDYLPKNYDLYIDEQKENLRIKHLLTMKSGLPSIEGGIVASKLILCNGDWVKFILSMPLECEPGEKFIYSSANTHLLTAIITNASGMSTINFAQKFLFDPLGIRNVYWEKDGKGFNFGGSNLFMSQYDLAKIGYLFLNNGVWDNKIIVSQQWIEQSLRSYYEWIYGFHYGYLWYLKNEKNEKTGEEYIVYSASGVGGQKIYVIPDLDIVIAAVSRTSLVKDNSYVLNDVIGKFILPSVKF
ncbi:MAG: serine hydrolase [Clostridiales bacterium]|jgi:CubicO group peptidase (beta-lactamase class C family)|nr:serine hydrolase [Clostridiales bacterium]